MNIFGFLLVFFCLLAKVSAECADSCECPDFSSLRDAQGDASDFQFTQLAGCAANATCVSPNNFNMLSNYRDSEIQQPPNTFINFLILSSGRNSSIPASSFDLFSYFGIVCEGGTWYATKYPMGILIIPNEGENYVYNDESLDGKRTMIYFYICNLDIS
ncbi:unnamed protein product [Caenorhabditis nigoni]|uniref:Uncharacterized protein n=1 Tax=Caenorhabditis nigoni TaxID=1611254 RepID=A0A2G5T8Y5_9PELO|nr:hypothetical protein B9Z55_017237 [Caenorhabditis nigoni]